MARLAVWVAYSRFPSLQNALVNHVEEPYLSRLSQSSSTIPGEHAMVKAKARVANVAAIFLVIWYPLPLPASKYFRCAGCAVG